MTRAAIAGVVHAPLAVAVFFSPDADRPAPPGPAPASIDGEPSGVVSSTRSTVSAPALGGFDWGANSPTSSRLVLASRTGEPRSAWGKTVLGTFPVSLIRHGAPAISTMSTWRSSTSVSSRRSTIVGCSSGGGTTNPCRRGGICDGVTGGTIRPALAPTTFPMKGSGREELVNAPLRVS